MTINQYNESEHEIINSIEKLCLREIPKYQNEQNYGKFPRTLFNSFAELGLTGLSISEDNNGLGANATTLAKVFEEISRHDLGPAIFLSVHCMVAKIIEKFGGTNQKQKYLDKLASGKLLGAFALTEPQAGSDAAALRTQAKTVDGGFVINGNKAYITSAGWADIYIVFARTDLTKVGGKGISAFIVEAGTKGINIGTPEKKMGCELSPIATLTFEEMFVPESQLIGTIDNGFAIALSGLAGGRVNIGACANGLSRAALDISIQYLKEREQFGSKLIEFQGLQFMLADMYMKYEASKLLIEKAANVIDNKESQKSERLYSSCAKCFATDSAMSITTDAVQLLGGAGYIKEYKVERLMRDAKMLQIVEGTNQIQRTIIARCLKD